MQVTKLPDSLRQIRIGTKGIEQLPGHRAAAPRCTRRQTRCQKMNGLLNQQALLGVGVHTRCMHICIRRLQVQFVALLAFYKCKCAPVRGAGCVVIPLALLDSWWQQQHERTSSSGRPTGHVRRRYRAPAAMCPHSKLQPRQSGLALELSLLPKFCMPSSADQLTRAQ